MVESLSGLMKGKKGIVTGVANKMSIAWGIAEQLINAGAEVILTYPADSLKKRIDALAPELSESGNVIHCDVTDQDSMDQCFDEIEKKFGKIDFLVHSIAFCKKEEFNTRYIETNRENFLEAMDISCYSFINLARKAEPIMNAGGSIITLTFYGSEKVINYYNIMGTCKAALESSVQYLAADLGPKNIRVNSISAGAIKTLASSAVKNIASLIKTAQSLSPLNKELDIADIGKTALYLLSDLSSGTTGEIIHVDLGCNIMVTPPEKVL